jgi:hypothetical protein
MFKLELKTKKDMPLIKSIATEVDFNPPQKNKILIKKIYFLGILIYSYRSDISESTFIRIR